MVKKGEKKTASDEQQSGNRQSSRTLNPECSSLKNSSQKYVLPVIYLLAIVILYLIFQPYLTALILGGIIVIFLEPVNRILKKGIKNRIITSWLMIIIVLLIILIPSYFVLSALVGESTKAYKSVSQIDSLAISDYLNEEYDIQINIQDEAEALMKTMSTYFNDSIVSLIGSITELAIAIFIMFFGMYYGFKEGDKILENFMMLIPFQKKHSDDLKKETNKVLYGVLYGQFLVGIIQGTLGGIGFWIFGVPNPVLWGFVMAFLSFLPVVGTPVVWIPAVLIEFAEGNTATAIGLLLYSGILVMNIDNLIKPKIIGDNAGMHPVLVLIGIFGGVSLFGIIGILIGPVVVSLCVLAIKFFNDEIKLNQLT